MKIRKQLLCLHGSESRTKAIPNLIFIQRRGEITISPRLIWVSFGGRATTGPTGEQGSGGAGGWLAKTYVDWIKLANYFHATLMDVVSTRTMKMLPIRRRRLPRTCLLHAVRRRVLRRARWIAQETVNRGNLTRQIAVISLCPGCCLICLLFFSNQKMELISLLYLFFNDRHFLFIAMSAISLWIIFVLFFHASTTTLWWHMYSIYWFLSSTFIPVQDSNEIDICCQIFFSTECLIKSFVKKIKHVFHHYVTSAANNKKCELKFSPPH